MQVATRFYEFEEFKRSVNRKIWTMVLGMLVLTLVALGVVFAISIRPVPVIAFDAAGRPILFEDTISPRLELQTIRVEHFTERFLEKWVGVNSLNLDRDLEEALGMMTPRLQKIVVNTPEEIERRAKYADANVASRFVGLQVRISDYDTKAEDAKIHVVAWGQMLFEPRVGAAPEGSVSQWFLSQLVISRVPVTKQTIYGMQASYVNTSLFDSQEQLEVHVLKRKK